MQEVDAVKATGRVMKLLKIRSPNLKAGEAFDLAAKILTTVFEAEAPPSAVESE